MVINKRKQEKLQIGPFNIFVNKSFLSSKIVNQFLKSWMHLSHCKNNKTKEMSLSCLLPPAVLKLKKISNLCLHQQKKNSMET